MYNRRRLISSSGIRCHLYRMAGTVEFLALEQTDKVDRKNCKRSPVGARIPPGNEFWPETRNGSPFCLDSIAMTAVRSLLLNSVLIQDLTGAIGTPISKKADLSLSRRNEANGGLGNIEPDDNPIRGLTKRSQWGSG